MLVRVTRCGKALRQQEQDSGNVAPYLRCYEKSETL
jgi:hypothetical protein